MREAEVDPIEDDSFAFDMSSPQSLRQSLPSPRVSDRAHDYNFSGHTYDETTDYVESTDDESVTDEHSFLRTAPSRQSSVSSFPASVIHHTPTHKRPSTPSKSPFNTNPFDTLSYTSHRPHSTGFRHPSSVRALQMRDEFDFTDADDLTPHRRRYSRLSYVSRRSTGSTQSSPTKSLRTRSAQSSSHKNTRSNLKREFPLVLLHCTLLPPPLFARAHALSSEKDSKDSVLDAIIPEPYATRWKVLHEKVVRNPEVKLRGVLIPHPQEDYELLHDKLLESLDLEAPRIRQDHYLVDGIRPASAVDSGFESAESGSSNDGDVMDQKSEHGERCPDCGHDFGKEHGQDRKWEVKVFAANGLMRAGAWSAAWPEMEKVDVEVDVWMPDDIKREVDSRLEALIMKEQEEKQEKKKKRRRRGLDEERAREIYGEPEIPPEKLAENPTRKQEEIDGLTDDKPGLSRQLGPPAPSSPGVRDQQNATHNPPGAEACQSEPDLLSALVKYLTLLAEDRRNIAIAMLCILMLGNVFGSPQQAPTIPMMDPSTKTPGMQTTEIKTQYMTTTSTSISVSTSVVFSVVTSLSATGDARISAQNPVASSTIEEPRATALLIADPGSVSAAVPPGQEAQSLGETNSPPARDAGLTESRKLDEDDEAVQLNAASYDHDLMASRIVRTVSSSPTSTNPAVQEFIFSTLKPTSIMKT